MLEKGEGGKRSVEADLRFVVPAPFSGPRGAAWVSPWRGGGEGPWRGAACLPAVASRNGGRAVT